MKHIKTYENLFYGKIGKFYKLHVNRSLEYFDIILDKMGIKEDFYEHYGIEDLYDLIDTNQEIILHNNTIYLLILDYDGDVNKYLFRPNKRELLAMFSESSLTDGGEIFVEDYDIDSRRYNL